MDSEPLGVKYFMEAIEDFSETIELEKENIHAWYHRGKAKYWLAIRKQEQHPVLKQIEVDFEEALKDCSKVIEISPDCIPAYQIRALTYNRLKKI